MLRRVCFYCLLTILSVNSTLRAQQSQEDLTALEALAEKLPTETKAGKMVADRTMAQSMIEYGLRTKNPEVILLAVEILHKNPVETVQGDERDATDFEKLILAAVEMKPQDEALIALAERVQDSLDENTRGLAGGPKSWIVKIKKGEYYQLDPRLV